MSAELVPEKLTCPKCGLPRIITRIKKPDAKRVILIMSCPKHRSEAVHKMTPEIFAQVGGLINDHLLRCRRCGEPTEVIGQRDAGRITVFSVRCPTHGTGERKVNTSLVESLGKDAPPPTPVAPVAPVTPATTETAAETPAQYGYCPSCGTPVEVPGAGFCHKCGASLD
jgi:hypothetical protein